MLVCIDTGIFLCLAFKDAGYEFCGKLLDDVFLGKIKAVISSLQLTEILTPFQRAHDTKGFKKMKEELRKLKLRVRNVDEEIAELASIYRSTIKTPEGKWLPLADSIVLATAKLEKTSILYTIDIDFYGVKEVKIMSPRMGLIQWVKQFGTARQKRILRLLPDIK